MVDIKKYRVEVKRRTCTVKELAEKLDTSYAKALRLTRIEGFPCLSFGRDKRIVLSKLDEWLEDHIGQVL